MLDKKWRSVERDEFIRYINNKGSREQFLMFHIARWVSDYYEDRDRYETSRHSDDEPSLERYHKIWIVFAETPALRQIYKTRPIAWVKEHACAHIYQLSGWVEGYDCNEYDPWVADERFYILKE